jgi:hypothetical protein
MGSNSLGATMITLKIEIAIAQELATSDILTVLSVCGTMS